MRRADLTSLVSGLALGAVVAWWILVEHLDVDPRFTAGLVLAALLATVAALVATTARPSTVDAPPAPEPPRTDDGKPE